MQSFICIDPYNRIDKFQTSPRGERLEANQYVDKLFEQRETDFMEQKKVAASTKPHLLPATKMNGSKRDVRDSKSIKTIFPEVKLEETTTINKTTTPLSSTTKSPLSLSEASSHMAGPIADESEQHNSEVITSTCNDRESARRLAKRLYNLSGFNRSDVCHHLVKMNPFSQLVAEEYLNLFDFRSMKLDAALRKFLSKLVLNGETQERERMLSRFSQRYYDCNEGKFPNADSVQTLVCAMILLNTDLHAPRSKKSKNSKICLDAFIDGLNSSVTAQCGESCAGESTSAIPYTFPRPLLIHLYESIKKKPLKCGSDDKCDLTFMETELDKIYNQSGSDKFNTLPTRRFAPGQNASSSTLTASSRRQFKLGLLKMNGTNTTSQSDSETTIQFKSGYLNRKRVFEPHGKPTSKGRRGWRRVYVILQDLRIIMKPGIYDEQKETAKSRAMLFARDMKNTIKIHHTFAKRSTTYTKREFVFHLLLPDQSEFLLQANNEQDLNSWIDAINFATACLSSPALPSAISNSKTAQTSAHKPILPMAYTKLFYWEQLIDHEDRLQRLKVSELDEHLAEATTTKDANKRHKTEFSKRMAYLKHEIERYTVYVELMRKKSNSPEAIVLSKHPHIASLTPSEEMIKLLPSPARSAITLEVPNE